MNPFELKIEEAMKNLKRDYTGALKTVKRLKDKINELERSRAKEGSVENDALRVELDSAVGELDAFVDSWILEVKGARNTYRILEELAGQKEHDVGRLKILRDLCEESEQLAKDLLCYSLAHLRS